MHIESAIATALERLNLNTADDLIDWLDGQHDIDIDARELARLFNAGGTLHRKGYRLAAGRFTTVSPVSKPPMRQPRQPQRRRQTLGSLLRSRLKATV